jgi:hypothetical protein
MLDLGITTGIKADAGFQASFRPQRAETNPLPGSACMLNGNKPLSIQESGNRIV